MRCLLLQIRKSGHIFAIKDRQCIFEVVVGEIGDQSDLLFVLLSERLDCCELMCLDFG